MTGKNIVFIAPEFFTFHKQIHKRLEELGNTVYFIPDRPSQKAIIKILIRKFRFLLVPYLNRFFKERAAAIPQNIDEVFIIRGEGLTSEALKGLRERFPKARFQLYLWDSVQRSPGVDRLMPLVDRVWTYDIRDAKKPRAAEGFRLGSGFLRHRACGPLESDLALGREDARDHPLLPLLLFPKSHHVLLQEILRSGFRLLQKRRIELET
jgi:hypothetical protein